ncbi:MAG: ABC transporter ATP-binding protein [Muribaculaceae bacterium]|nr:ABC transporter ATP-binding protein [Muribaculaceae bacterium]
MIEVKIIIKRYGDLEVLRSVSVTINDGEIVAIVGPSGAGKTTLLQIIGTLDAPQSGQVLFDGIDVLKLKQRELAKFRNKNIGFVFQFYNLVMNLNVEDNIMLPEIMKGKKKADLKSKLDEILEITGLSDKRKAMPATLSGGQQQRVAIARAVMGDPDVILADEPTGNLDSKSSEEIMELFSRLNKEKGLTILQVTHSEKCASYGTRTIMLDNGKTVG